jgi:hypothetical protein
MYILYKKCQLLLSNSLLFADDLEVYLAISSPSDCLLLQLDIDHIHNGCSANFMKPNFSFSFTRKTNVLNYQCRLRNYFILRTDCVKDLGVHIDCRLHIHRHVDLLLFKCNEIIWANLQNVFSGTKYCPSVLSTVGLWVPTWNIRNVNMLTCSSSHCPSARCVSTTNTVCKPTDIFSNSL